MEGACAHDGCCSIIHSGFMTELQLDVPFIHEIERQPVSTVSKLRQRWMQHRLWVLYDATTLRGAQAKAALMLLRNSLALGRSSGCGAQVRILRAARHPRRARASHLHIVVATMQQGGRCQIRCCAIAARRDGAPGSAVCARFTLFWILWPLSLLFWTPWMVNATFE